MAQRSLRLVHVHDRYRSSQPSGETMRVEQEAQLLRQAGHDVRMLVVENDLIETWGPAKRASLPARAVWSQSSYRRISSAVRESRPDAVHIHNTLPLASPSVFWAAKHAGAPVVHTLANYRMMCPQGAFTRDGRVCTDCMHRRVPWPGVVHACYRGSRGATATVAAMLAIHDALGTLNRTVDLFLIGSRFGRDRYVEAGLPGDRVIVKPNTAPDPGRTRRSVGGPFLFAGRLDPEKGVGLLLEALARSDALRSHGVTIAGDGPDRARLEEVARALGVLDDVLFVGMVPRLEVQRLMLRSRALVSPSVTYEVSPISVVEAFAAGVPAIVPRGGAQASIVDHRRTGLHFSGDASSLRDAMCRLLDDETCRQMGARARTTYEVRHSNATVLQVLEEAYERARRRDGRRP